MRHLKAVSFYFKASRKLHFNGFMKTKPNFLKAILSLFAAIICSSSALAKAPIADLSLKEISYKTIDYALKTQIQTQNNPFYLSGEFPTKIQSTLVPALIGVGEAFSKNDEASAFTTASVLNLLSQIYIDHPEFKNESPLNLIPQSLQNGVSTFDKYKSTGTYNFYPARVINGQTVRRPINMRLFPLWHGFTNIPNDADTTSVVLTTLLFNSKINKVPFTIPQQTYDIFSQFSDVNRNPMFYNYFAGRKNTGAFMTWLLDEKSPNMPRFYFAQTAKGERIPFIKNDVDCVVNANILRLLALGNTTTAGHAKSCQMLNDMIDKNEHASCGVYYPNTLNLSFVLGRAKKAGETCVTEKSEQKIIELILKMQNADGSWLNEKNVWQDPIITTAFALDALLHFSKPSDHKTYIALMYGVHFLLKNMKQKDTAIHWNAERFFTATAIARSLIMWQSAAFTNSVIASVLLKMHVAFPQYTARNYLTLKFDENVGGQK